MPAPGKDKNNKNGEKISNTKIQEYKENVVARPVGDLNLKFGEELPENVFLHGSKEEEGEIKNFDPSSKEY